MARYQIIGFPFLSWRLCSCAHHRVKVTILKPEAIISCLKCSSCALLPWQYHRQSGSIKRRVFSIVLEAAGSRLGRYCLGWFLGGPLPGPSMLPSCWVLAGHLPCANVVRRKVGREADSRREEEGGHGCGFRALMHGFLGDSWVQNKG